MNNEKLITKLLKDLKNHSNMQDDLYLQKFQALRTLYVRENDTSHALGINLEFRKRIDKILSSASLGINERKRLLKKHVYILVFCSV